MPGCSRAISPLIRATSRTKTQMQKCKRTTKIWFRASFQEKKKNKDFVRANHKVVVVTCKAQALPPQTHLSSGEQKGKEPPRGELVTQRKQNHSPPAPWGPGSLSHPSDPASPGREAGIRASARCPPRGSSCLWPIPHRRVRERTQSPQGLCPKAGERGLEPGMELGPSQTSKGVSPGKGMEGRSNDKTPRASPLTHVKSSRTWQAIFTLHPLEKPKAA